MVILFIKPRPFLCHIAPGFCKGRLRRGERTGVYVFCGGVGSLHTGIMVLL